MILLFAIDFCRGNQRKLRECNESLEKSGNLILFSNSFKIKTVHKGRISYGNMNGCKTLVESAILHNLL